MFHFWWYWIPQGRTLELTSTIENENSACFAVCDYCGGVVRYRYMWVWSWIRPKGCEFIGDIYESLNYYQVTCSSYMIWYDMIYRCVVVLVWREHQRELWNKENIQTEKFRKKKRISQDHGSVGDVKWDSVVHVVDLEGGGKSFPNHN